MIIWNRILLSGRTVESIKAVDFCISTALNRLKTVSSVGICNVLNASGIRRFFSRDSFGERFPELNLFY